MKKRDVINLIKCYSEQDDQGFRDEAYSIANDFDAHGDHQLAEYIMALLSDTNAFVPQELDGKGAFCTKTNIDRRPLVLPRVISLDLDGIMNAIKRKSGVSKFLFYGSPGTGKSESVKYIAYLLGRDLLTIEFSEIIDSKLGQTSKNITTLFGEIKSYRQPDRLLFLFDELDALALDRINSRDLREMGRATSAFLKELDNLPDDIVVFATTNLFSQLDKALVRRFDACINFDRYSTDDLIESARVIMDSLLSHQGHVGRDARLFDKIVKISTSLPSPAELYNVIKTSIAFSDPEDEYDYLRRLYEALIGPLPASNEELQGQGFTIREIGRLTGTPKSTVARNLKENS